MIVGIFGSAKGGTSAVAGVVQLLGWPMHYSHTRKLDDHKLLTSANKAETIAERGAHWAFKHPFLDSQEIFGLIPTLTPIYVYRDPVAVIQHHKEGAGQEQVRQKLEEYLTLTNGPNGLYISYEKLKEDTPLEVRRIADYLGVQVNQKAIDWVQDQKGYRDIRKYL